MPTRAGAARRRGKALGGPAPARGVFVGAARSPRAAISTTVDACHLRRLSTHSAVYFKQLYDCASSILRMRPIVVFAVTAGGVFSM